MVPNDSPQTEYLLGDGGHAKVRVAVRRAPITGKPTPSGVVDHLKRPTQLGNDVGVGQCGHVRMGPCVHRNIILIGLEGRIELVPIVEDVRPDKEVGRPDLILSKECIEAIRWLHTTWR
jgi:hypothetical protein